MDVLERYGVIQLKKKHVYMELFRLENQLNTSPFLKSTLKDTKGRFEQL